MHQNYWIQFDLRATVYRSFVIAALFVLAAGLAWSQVAATLSPSTTFRPDTPRKVKDGTATLVGHYNPNQMLRLTLGLQPPHVAQEQQFLESLQSKGSHDFHHFLSAEEWINRFDPSVEDEQAVVDWATSQGLTVTRRFPNRLIVDVEGPAGTIEKVVAGYTDLKTAENPTETAVWSGVPRPKTNKL